MSRKTALITGVTGQDGSYLAELLLDKGYEVHGVKRKSSSFNTDRVDHLHSDRHDNDGGLKLHYADLSDFGSILSVIERIEPTEVYNLAAQSHVGVSFQIPEYTSDINALGSLRILEAIRMLGLGATTKYYQASSSELYGLVQSSPQNEKTPFYPRSPYAVAKLYAYWITVNYRESYGIFASNGILFNHESPRRGETFVTRKITMGLSDIFKGEKRVLYLGNLDALRDWGHAKDYVDMQWRILQHHSPDDFVIGTGVQCSVRNFCEKAALVCGVTLDWVGSGLEEKGVVVAVADETSVAVRPGDEIIKVDAVFFRPSEVETLLADASKGRALLGWKPAYSLDDLIVEMMMADR
ncbi:GDP-mannose 4,6-dehydratase [Litoricola sp.]|nr:GDP-mannose 4,6-dehydratase [Litorivicinus sp.]